MRELRKNSIINFFRSVGEAEKTATLRLEHPSQIHDELNEGKKWLTLLIPNLTDVEVNQYANEVRNICELTGFSFTWDKINNEADVAFKDGTVKYTLELKFWFMQGTRVFCDIHEEINVLENVITAIKYIAFDK
jgi:hypothetical protein